MSNKIAIMQPYIFPYIGYMNLVNESDIFVFYDDVNFIKKGWINRNKIILNGDSYRFTLPLEGASQNKLIKDIKIDNLNIFSDKFLAQINTVYKNSMYFKETKNYIEDVLFSNTNSIGDIAANSVEKFFNYIDVEKIFIRSSKNFSSSFTLKKADRLIRITKELNSKHYINSIGGADLYSKEYFNKLGVKLNFVCPKINEYLQFNTKLFIPNLSIIDLMMNLSIVDLKKHLKSYVLI